MGAGGKTMHAASASASAKNEGPREVPYAMPSLAKLDAAPPPVSLAAGAAAGGPTEIVERPAPYTLARGRYEAKPALIWLVCAAAIVFFVGWIALRLRRASIERARAAQLRRTLPRASASS